jgi:hypothetical protein
MARKRKVRRTPGDVVAVPLGDGRRGFGLVLDEPLVAFFSVASSPGAEPRVDEIVRAPIAFRIWVTNQPIWDGEWQVVGHVAEIPPALREPPWFFKQDPISGKLTVGRTGAEELPPEPGQVDRLERAAVWSANHVVDRLEDHLAGRPNAWFESLRPKR